MARLVLAVPLFCALAANAQSVKKTPRKVPGADKPVCSTDAICFSGTVATGEEFRKTLNTELEFVLERGWTIAVVPKRPEGQCTELASVVNPPYRAHRDLYIDTSYGWTAEQEVSASPREFQFVTNCTDYRTESGRLSIVLWPYTATPQQADEALAKLGTSAVGKGRLWITASRISHTDDTPDEKPGKIESMSFSVEVRLPRRQVDRRWPAGYLQYRAIFAWRRTRRRPSVSLRGSALATVG
jgi:hypothetical protein